MARVQSATVAVARIVTKFSTDIGAGVRDFLPTAKPARSDRAATARMWFPKESRRFTAAVVVICLHLAILWALTASLRHIPRSDDGADIQVAVVSRATPRIQILPEPILAQPQTVLVSPPDISIASELDAQGAISTANMSQMLPPRPDPLHSNLPPDLPGSFKRLGSVVSAMLRIFVLPDETVADAKVARSTGDGQLDAVAIAYVKENWRFMPALMSGRAVQSWTTVLVSFKPS